MTKFEIFMIFTSVLQMKTLPQGGQDELFFP